MKTILITGGAGYIGSHAVVIFEQAGYKTVTIDNFSNSSIKALNGIEKILGYKPDFFEVDLRGNKEKGEREKVKEIGKTNCIDGKLAEGDYSLEDIFKKYNFDGVIHFAGLKAVGESCDKPLEYHENNIVGSIRLFELMEKYDVKNIIFSSSATVYKPLAQVNFQKGDGKQGYSETDLTGECSNPYGTSKFVLEQILRDLAIHSGFCVMNLRYFNPIGAHSSGYIGEDPNGIPNNLLPYIMKVAVGELPYLNVFGNNYPTIDGTGVRDYIDVVDLVDGHLLAYNRMQDKKGTFETYNLGTGRGVSVLEMLNAVKSVTGIDIAYKVVGRRDGDLAEVFCNPSKAYNELGFKTMIILEESLLNSWKYYKNLI